MLVTIGIPVRNGERFLADALESACAQTHEELEILVSDNGSTDGTIEICERFAAADPRVRVLREEENRGAAANFNKLAREARGEAFWWLPHDDRLLPRAVETCVEILRGNPEVLSCHPRSRQIDVAGNLIGSRDRVVDLRSPSPSRRLGRLLVNHSRCDGVLGLHRREELLRSGLIRGYRGGDEILYAELALRGPIWEVAEPLFERRVHEESSLVQAEGVDAVTAWFDPHAQIEIKDVGAFLRSRFLKTINDLPMHPSQRLLARIQVWRWWLVRGARLLKRRLTCAVVRV